MKIAAADIGGTAIKYGLYENGSLTEMHEIPTNAEEGGRAVLQRTMEAVSGLPEFRAVGISTAGQVDRKKGSIIFSNANLPDYTGVNVRAVFEKRFGLPTAVENDVNAAALGEAEYGAGKKLRDFLMLTYGTGVGGAIVTDGRLYSGSTMSAGEFGGMVLHPEKMEKGILYSGCYEKYASVTALTEKVGKKHPELKDGRSIFQNLEKPEIRQAVDEWVFEVSAGLVSLIHIFNPAAVILGGGIMKQEIVFNGIRTAVKPYLAGGFQNTAILQAALGNAAGMIGAGASAEKRVRELRQKNRKK